MEIRQLRISCSVGKYGEINGRNIIIDHRIKMPNSKIHFMTASAAQDLLRQFYRDKR